MKTERWIIDGNKLFNLIRDDIDINGSMFARVKMHMNDASLIDTKEVVHGRWIYEPVEFTYEKDIKCSVCGSYVECVTNYCPNCGAHMDLED